MIISDEYPVFELIGSYVLQRLPITLSETFTVLKYHVVLCFPMSDITVINQSDGFQYEDDKTPIEKNQYLKNLQNKAQQSNYCKPLSRKS